MHCLLQKNINPAANNFKWIVNLLNLLLQRSGVLALSPVRSLICYQRLDERRECYSGDQMWCQQAPARRLWPMSAPYMCTHVVTTICNTCEVWAEAGGASGRQETVWLTLIWLLRPDGPGWQEVNTENNLSSSSLTATRMNEARIGVILRSWISPTCLKLSEDYNEFCLIWAVMDTRKSCTHAKLGR